MIEYNKIRHVHLEISTRCNAACPDCPRNFRGVDILDHYPLLDMKLDQAKQIFSVDFVQQLDTLLINGNYGDFVTATDGLAIVKYFLNSNPRLQIEISTNASAKPKIWEPLGQLGITVDFRIDGLKDTHHLYRQKTDFDFVIENAKKFISAGGRAVWSMIKFNHNQHQIEECKKLSEALGFERFWLVDNGRDTMPVFTADKQLSHIIGDYRGSTDFDTLYNQSRWYLQSPTSAIMNEKHDRKINCVAKNGKEIYVAANGEVYPCCWTGFYPLNSNRNSSNVQLKPLIKNNNALTYGIEEAIRWFNQIEESWKYTVPKGKIFACNENCGTRK